MQQMLPAISLNMVKFITNIRKTNYKPIRFISRSDFKTIYWKPLNLLMNATVMTDELFCKGNPYLFNTLLFPACHRNKWLYLGFNRTPAKIKPNKLPSAHSLLPEDKIANGGWVRSDASAPRNELQDRKRSAQIPNGNDDFCNCY